MVIEPQDPATQDSGSGTSIEKFTSPEARDQAYLELEKLSYSQTQRLADLEKKLEAMEVMQQQASPQDQRSFTDLYPSQQPQVDKRETELASRILTRPSEVLREHAQYVRRETLKEVQQEMQAQRAIDRFQVENPDLARHEDIVSIYVRRQPDNLTPAERLKRAAPEVRKYLADIAKGNNQQASQQLDPATYVESPTSHPSGAPAAPAQPQSQEDELSEMIRERHAIQDKKRL
jgi:hypothetical protein